MDKIKFECVARRDDGEKLYRLSIDGAVVREDLTLDEVICAINRRDEKELSTGARREKPHAPRYAKTADRGPGETR